MIAELGPPRRPAKSAARPPRRSLRPEQEEEIKSVMERLLGLKYDPVDPQTLLIEFSLPGFFGRRIGFVTSQPQLFRVFYSEKIGFIDVDLAEPDTQRPAALVKLRRFVAINPEFGFRVYRTAGGLRYLLTSHSIRPEGEQMSGVCAQLAADPAYVRLCRESQLFAARLDPKPKRCVMPKASYAVCQYLWHEGNPAIEPDALIALKFHDHETGAHADMPLA